nr:ORF6N domain-containing protein [Pseudomarimonas arenosa]
MISSAGHGGRRTAPYAFTAQGVAMLSSVLNSPRAIAVNIEIMRTFVRVRELAATHAHLAEWLADLEQKTEALAIKHDGFSRDPRAVEAGVRCLARIDDAAGATEAANRLCGAGG